MSIHRRIISIGIIVLLSVSALINCTKEVGSDKLLERNGLMYEINSKKPYTGLAIDTYKNGQQKFAIEFIDGERNGTSEEWYENGQQKSEESYKDGKLHGLKKLWYENGQLKSEESNKDGNLVSSPTRWFPDGTRADLTDIDGNVYKTAKIGNQVWMAENLKVTHYRDGTAISHVTDSAAWSKLSTEVYCIYDNNAANEVDTYGALYNWYAVNVDTDGDGVKDKEIAPEGWHVPSDDEWKELEMYLGMSQSEAEDEGWRGTNEGSKLAGNADLWDDGDLEDDPEFGTSGFTALPGGGRLHTDGYYDSMGLNGAFWSATETSSTSAWYRVLYCNDSHVYRANLSKRIGFSVRCVKDKVIGESTSKIPQKVTEIDVSLLKKRNGIQYEGNSDKPFTGMVTAMYPNGQYKIKFQLKDGVQSGAQRKYFDNGQVMAEGLCEKGKQNGLTKTWFENGQRRSETLYKDDALDGPSKRWYENGQMEKEKMYKDGKLNGLIKSWYENGQKQIEVMYKAGRINGMLRSWWEDGEQSHETSYQDDGENRDLVHELVYFNSIMPNAEISIGSPAVGNAAIISYQGIELLSSLSKMKTQTEYLKELKKGRYDIGNNTSYAAVMENDSRSWGLVFNNSENRESLLTGISLLSKGTLDDWYKFVATYLMYIPSSVSIEPPQGPVYPVYKAEWSTGPEGAITMFHVTYNLKTELISIGLSLSGWPIELQIENLLLYLEKE